MGSKKHPGKFDCYHAAEEDEPFFTLLGRDPAAPFVVGFWIEMRKAMGQTSEEKLHEAGKCADDMAKWASSKGKDILRAIEAARSASKTMLKEVEGRDEQEPPCPAGVGD